MPKPYKNGDKVLTYKITSTSEAGENGIVNMGEFAWSYFAEDDSGRKVFFKQYIDPTEISPDDEFVRFIDAQQEFKKILDTLPFAEQMYEIFEIEGIHYQAKEFMEGKDLKKYLEENPKLSLEMRKYIALVFIFALNKIHESGIVHTDLKPAQIYIEEAPELELKYKVKICDFDFSRIPGTVEPIRTVTTQFFSSPEHLKGEKIEFASDRFTAGLMLYEILIGVNNPYDIVSVEEYKNAVLRYKTKPPRDFNDLIPKKLSQQIYSLLSPEMDKRCELDDIHKELIDWDLDHPKPIKIKVPKRVYFSSSSGSVKPSFHKSQIITRDDLRIFPDYKYVSKKQLELFKGDESWTIKGLEGVVNDTFLNKTNITSKEEKLSDGDIIFIGNIRTKNGLELKVEFSKD